MAPDSGKITTNRQPQSFAYAGAGRRATDLSMKEMFREAFIRHVRVYGVSLAEVARQTGVSKYLLNALHQRKTQAPNVHDAIRIAAFFGKTVEEFMRPESGEKQGENRLRALAARLTEEERAVLEAQIEVLLRRRRASRGAPR